jgi:hypothetical protein
MRMSKRLSQTQIVHDLADCTAKRVTRRAILALRRMTDYLGSGDDSELKNTWEEICVQVQFEQSVMWDAYEQTMCAFLAGEVELLRTHEREALWLQTPQGEDWDCEDNTDRDPYPVFNDDIVRYLLQAHLLAEAGRWSNPRIRVYLDRATATD